MGQQKLFRGILLLFLFASGAFAQNLQLHYEVDKDRQNLNTLLEDYKFDPWGSTYWFVNFFFDDPNEVGSSSLSSVYGEIARYINLPFLKPLSFTLQYNDGVYYGGSNDPFASGQIGSIWLTGLSYPLPFEKVTAQIDLLAVSRQTADDLDAQVTLVWFWPMGAGKLQFVGYLDIWTEMDTDGEKGLVVLSEPQLWYNVWEKLDVGLGAEVTHNFPVYLPEELEVFPNLSLRWNF